MKKNLSFILLLLLVFNFLPPGIGSVDSSGSNPPKSIVHPDVDAAFETEQSVGVLVMLEEQVDVMAVADKSRAIMPASASDSLRMQAARHAVVYALQQTAQRTQASLLDYIIEQKSLGQVAEYKSYYIVNIIYVEATKEVIKEIALMPEVKSITLDEAIYQVEPTWTAGELVDEEGVAWNIQRVGAPAVWDQYGIDGTGIVIGILDSGVDWEHPALMTNWRGYCPDSAHDPTYSWFDAVDGSHMPLDATGHGTHVMGTIVGATDDIIIGVAPGAKWIAARVLKENQGSASWALAAGEFMLAPGGDPAMAPSVINNSWGGGAGSDWFLSMIRAWRAAGILPVFAAGNDGPEEETISYPGLHQEAFAVGAIDEDNNLAWFSSRGPGPEPGIKPDIVAPGVAIVSSFPGSGYAVANGTSMAAPHVAGVAALLLQTDSKLTPYMLEAIMRDTATILTDSDYPEHPNYGYGYGLVNAFNAVAVARNYFCQLHGTVVDQDSGEPIAGVAMEYTISGFVYSRVVTDEDGNYSLDLPTGTYQLNIFHKLYGLLTIEDLVVPEGEIEHNYQLINNAGTFEGQVLDNRTGVGVPDVVVDFWHQDFGKIDSIETDEDGNFNVSLTEGDFEIYFSHPYYKDKSIELSLTDSVTTPILLEFEAYNIFMGKVVDEKTGQGIEGAYVSIFLDSSHIGLSMKTGEDGSFFLKPDTGAGLYRVSVKHDDYWNLEKTDFMIDGITILNAQLGTDRLIGRITDSDTEEGIEGVSVRVYPTGGGTITSSTTDQDGYYSIMVPPGNYGFNLVHTDYWRVFLQDIEISGETILNKTMDHVGPKGTLSGQMVNFETGQELENVRLDFYRFEFGWVAFARTDSSGHYSLELPLAKYVVRISHSDFEECEAVVEIEECGNILDLKLLPKGFVLPPTHRNSGPNRFATAVSISQELFAEDNSAQVVILARADAFPDALAGVPLGFDASTGQAKGPLLLTSSVSLTPETAIEITRVLENKGTIYVLGGHAAISEDVVSELAELGDYNIVRLSGEGRFETAVEIAKEVSVEPQKVFLATGMNFPDALSAAGVAARMGAPVLMTQSNQLNAATQVYLEANRDSIQLIYVIGGTGVINPSVAAAAAEAASADYQRISGSDRFLTAVEVGNVFFNNPQKYLLTTGMNFPDALAGGILAAQLNVPLLLNARRDELQQDVNSVLSQNRVLLQVIIIGGQSVVAQAVEEEIGLIIGRTTAQEWNIHTVSTRLLA